VRYIVRKKLPKPTADKLKVKTGELVHALKAGDNPPIDATYKISGVKKVLRDQMFESCCCFCETRTEAGNFGQVEHYRPKAIPAFRPLAYTWSNLLWACGRCNGLKSDLWNDAAPLLNPCLKKDNPPQHLSWNEHVVLANTPRGEYTVALLDMNCADGKRSLQSLEERRDWLGAVRLAWTTAADMSSSQHAVARTLLGKWLGAGGPFRGMLAGNGLTLAAIP